MLPILFHKYELILLDAELSHEHVEEESGVWTEELNVMGTKKTR